MNSVNAFILASGRGERLRPITDHLPKPLLPVLGKPIIQIVLERLTALDVVNIGVNTYYQRDLMQKWLDSSAFSGKIIIFPELEILGTGGALKNAATFLGQNYFITHNADIMSDIDLGLLLERHRHSGDLVTLAVHSKDQFNNVWIDREGRLLHIGKEPLKSSNGLRCVAFTGIAAYSPDFLGLLPDGASHVPDVWMKAASYGKVGTIDFSGCGWIDIGTPAAYAQAVFEALAKEGESVFVHPTAHCGEAVLGAKTVLEERVVLTSGCSLRNSILFAGAQVVQGAHMENVIIGPDYVLPLEERLALPLSLTSSVVSDFISNAEAATKMTLIGAGGSDRSYFKITDGHKTAVLMQCPSGDLDYQRHIIYTQFFRKNSVPAPELLAAEGDRGMNPAFADRGHKYAVFEYLGDISLYSWLRCRRKTELIETLYQKVLDVLVRLHTDVTRSVADCPLLKSRIFDYAHLRWETDYFIERFICGLKGIHIIDREALSHEFHQLARQVDSFTKTIIHRDFQSQNIMITQGDTPRIIDYQGARMGPPAYDLASLLWDPYVDLDNSMRERLLTYYLDKFLLSSASPDKEDFLRTLLPCRLQRHMQALGAYGFLSQEKQKTYFLKYIPRCLSYLREETEIAGNRFPALHNLVKGISE